MALPRNQRIRRTREFGRVRAQGRSWTGRLLILAVLPLSGEPHCRFGVTVTRRLGNAVTRNKLRRRLSSIAGSLCGEISAPYLIVAIPRREAVDAAFEALRSEWIKLARRAGLLPVVPSTS
jgi:ribonuclease P protein component